MNNTIITYEYPADYDSTKEAYYPVETRENINLYSKYVNDLQMNFPNVQLCGRLSQYKYLDMDDAIDNAMKAAGKFIENYKNKNNCI